ncbi:hypothetical protein D3C75_1331530 [compost metagenome]
MNKPDNILPKGDFGVVNDFAGTQPAPRNRIDIEMGIARPESFKEKTVLQWAMPKALTDSQIKER